MIIKYFNNSNLAYSNRKRYRNITLTPFAQETQRSVLLGDGANTSIKTSKKNICNYVMIDNTRWYVTSYVYLNGAQVQLNLQRDVIGEFGIENVFGKIERGYTNGILKYRKELSLNQVLKKRDYLIPDTKTYGNYSVNTHEKEIWGLLYLTKPTNGDTLKTINIPAFSPKISNEPYIPNNSKYNISETSDCYIGFYVGLTTKDNGSVREKKIIEIRFHISNGKYTYSHTISPGDENANGLIINISSEIDIESNWMKIYDTICNYIAEEIINGSSTIGLTLPTPVDISSNIPYEYNNITIEHNGKYLSYSTSSSIERNYGSGFISGQRIQEIASFLSNKSFDGFRVEFTTGHCSFKGDNGAPWGSGHNNVEKLLVNYEELTNEEAGNIVINFEEDLVNEPFFILAFPLYNVTISKGTERYTIKKDVAFNIFNTVVQYLSGESGYLVDAQIYPYCPQLVDVVSKLNNYPFFSISASNYEYNSTIQLQPYSDVKKEYIKREYSIIAPDQSSKFDFNFYDYVNNFSDNNGINYSSITFRIKTSLKPFSIICSAVIIPSSNSLKGITYDSDLRGCKPSSGGFECSLASNEYQTYLRNNSNYQQIFAKQQESLAKQHEVEHINEVTSSVVNSISAASMGAIGGAAMADAGIFGELIPTKAVGAGVGAAAAGGTVAAAMTVQTIANDKLRDYEYNLQQEMFNLQIGTIKNLPNSINRISSFNEIILRDFWFVVETYECTQEESFIVDTFLDSYSYLIGVYDYIYNYVNEGWFIRAKIISSTYAVNLSVIADKELKGGVYIYEQV